MDKVIIDAAGLFFVTSAPYVKGMETYYGSKISENEVQDFMLEQWVRMQQQRIDSNPTYSQQRAPVEIVNW